MLKRLSIFAAVAALMGALVFPLAGRSDVPAASAAFNVSTTGPTGTLSSLNGSVGFCQVTVSSPTTGFTITPQVSADGVTWSAATTINNGSITAPGTYVGAVNGTNFPNFRINVGAVGSGSLVGYVVCSQSQPLPAYSPFPTAAPTQFPIVNPSGSPIPAGYHCVLGSVAAVGASTSVTFSPAFVQGGVLQPIIDATDGTVVAESAISAITVSGFTFVSTSGKTYAFQACGV
jgi:hypothetical protein